jgi:hypothetical protein
VRHTAPDLHFLCVVDDAGAIEATKKRLAELVLPALDVIDRARWSVRLHVRAGRAAEEIADLAGEVGARLVVIGRFGVHHPHRHLAKTASDIIDLAPCPVYVAVLAEGAVQTSPICPDCAKARSESEGERWFCDRHRSDRVSTRVLFGSNFTGSSQLW